MKSILTVPSLIVLLSLGLAGAAAAKETILPTVGPEIEHFQGPMVGYLRVFTATTEKETGETYEYPHTDYRVCAPSGKVVAFVANGDGNLSGAPDTVELSPGKYIVHAESDKDGFVAVPVIIKGGHTTVVDLESNHVGSLSEATHGRVIALAGSAPAYSAGDAAPDINANWNQ